MKREGKGVGFPSSTLLWGQEGEGGLGRPRWPENEREPEDSRGKARDMARGPEHSAARHYKTPLKSLATYEDK